MPRDGLGIFTAPHPDVVTQTTIDSGVHNGIVHDFVTDANAPRPVIAGGTGANNAKDARTNLQAEVAGVLVTNYDNHVFENGSFYSAIAATGAPNATDYFVGTAIILTPPNVSLVLQARSINSGVPYVRIKTGGTWSAWAIDGAADYVNVNGDTMTGALTVPTVYFGGQNNYVSQDGLNLFIRSNSGVYVQNPSGAAQTISIGQPSSANHATTKQYVDAADTANANAAAAAQGTANTAAANAAAAQSTANSANANAAAAQSTANSANANADNRLLRTTDTFTGNLTITASLMVINVYASGQVNSNSNTMSPGALGQAAFRSSGEYGGGYSLNSNSGFWGALYEQSGYIYLAASSTPSVGAGWVKLDVAGHFTVGGHGWQPGGGTWGDSASDARVKNVVCAYDSGLAEILNLDPVVYTFKGNDGGEDSPHKAFADSGKEFTGLIAQEVEAVMPEMVIKREGVIDGHPVSDFRMLDTSPLIYALVNAVKELSARIEVLEAKL
jgi:hypothetical protein